MKKRLMIVIPLILFAFQATSVDLTGREIVAIVDDALDKTGGLSETEMRVYRDGKLRKTYRMVMKSCSPDRILAEFLYPPRNKGQKFLKVNDSLWLYYPNTGKTLRISAKASFSGSDFSNADILSVRLDKDYEVQRTDMEYWDGEAVYKLDLRAKSEGATYSRILYWVREKDRMPLEREFYSLSGLLLKTLVMTKETDLFEKMPDTYIMINVLEKNKKSVLQYLSYRESQALPPDTLRQNSLSKRR
jgi:outer membrane lipoprotein-sorting protein